MQHLLLLCPLALQLSPPHCIGPLLRIGARRATTLALVPLPADASDSLAFRVRDALIEEDERPFLKLSGNEPRPLKVNLDLLNYRARRLEQKGDVHRASETLEWCTKLDPNDGRAWIARARLRERAGAFDEALELLSEGLRWEPESAYLLQATGAVHERAGSTDEALEAYSAAVRANPRHAPAWVACGLLLERQRQYDAAAQCLRLAGRVAPASYFVWQVIGEWHKRRGELGSAREAYRRSLQLNSRNAATYHAWGVLEWRCAHHSLAAILFQKGLEASPHNRYILQSWGCMEARTGNLTGAEAIFARARRRRSRPDGATWQARALQLAAQGQLDEAREAFERGVALEPTHTPLYHAWGQVELEVANVSGARDVYQRGVWASRGRDERGSCSIWTAWALLEERAGRAGQARVYLREAVRRDRFAVDVRVVWAGLEARQNNMVAARELFEGAILLDETNVVVWEAYEEMERARGFAMAANRIADRAEAARLAQPSLSTGTNGGIGAVPGGGVGTAGGPTMLPTKSLVAAAYAAEDWLQQQQQQSQSQSQSGSRSGGAQGTRTSSVQQAYGLAP